MAAGYQHTVLSGRRNWVSPDLGLLRVIVLPWSVSGAVHRPFDYGDKIMVLRWAPRGLAHKHRAGSASKWQHPLKPGQQPVGMDLHFACGVPYYTSCPEQAGHDDGTCLRWVPCQGPLLGHNCHGRGCRGPCGRCRSGGALNPKVWKATTMPRGASL